MVSNCSTHPPETHELEQFETQTATETSAMNVMPSTHSRQLRKAHEQIAESRSRIHPPGTHDAAWQVEEIPDLAPYPTPSSQIHIGLQQHANARFSQPHAQDVRYEPQELATIRTTLGMPERPMQKTHLVSESIDEALTEENFEGIQASQWQPSAWALAEVEQTASSISPSHNPKPFLAQPLHQSDVVPHGKRQQARAARAMNARPQAVLSASAPHGQPNSVARNGMTNITSMTPTIHVTIGRVEVRATSPPISSARKPAETKTGPSLDDYLRARNSGGQGGNP